MRMDSAAVAKGHFAPSSHRAPKEGTRLRRLYDLLMANKGVPIEQPLTMFENRPAGVAGALIEQLRNYYGLDIRKLRYGRWVLAGEWFGTTYRDYIVDRLRERGAIQ